MKTMLIVDDEAKICAFLASFFTSRGFRTVTAQSGSEAMEKLDRDLPDYMLLDIRMPDLSGLDVLKLAKGRYPQIKIVMVSAVDDEHVAETAFQLGAADYITKPFGLDDQAWARAFFAQDD